MKLNRKPALLPTVSALLIYTSYAQAATVTQLNSASQLGRFGSDTSLNLSTTNLGAALSSPRFNTGNDLVTFFRGYGPFEVDRVGVNYGASAFANGTYILGAGGFQGPGDGGAITLTFTIPVAEFGVNVEEFNTGNYAVGFTAYNAAGVALGNGQYLASGSDPYSLSFEGLSVTGDLIKSIRFDDINQPHPYPGDSNNLLFGNLAFYPSTVPLQAPPPDVPEPSTIAQLALGIVGLAWFTRRSMSKRQN